MPRRVERKGLTVHIDGVPSLVLNMPVATRLQDWPPELAAVMFGRATGRAPPKPKEAPVNVHTGVYVPLTLSTADPVPGPDWVEVHGTPEQIEELSRAVRRGQSASAKRARRKQAQASRRRNR